MFSNTDRVTRTDIADLEDEIERIDGSIETIMERIDNRVRLSEWNEVRGDIQSLTENVADMEENVADMEKNVRDSRNFLRHAYECDREEEGPDGRDPGCETTIRQIQEGGRRKKRKTRKRRRKKRTKKKTRRKRRKSRKRKPKRRRKKKTRKRKAGCWPFCRRRPRVLEETPLVQQQPQEARTMTPRERAARLQHEFEGLKSSRTRHYQDEMDRRLDARKAKQREVGGTQGGDD